jgi:hypothetical protein
MIDDVIEFMKQWMKKQKKLLRKGGGVLHGHS